MLKSFKDAFNGIGTLVRTERNFQIHLGAFVLVLAASIYYEIKIKEFIVVLLISALVFALEAINTAIEKLCNEVTEERKESIRIIKDISAGAVLIASIFAFIIGLAIFVPYVIGWKSFSFNLF